MRPIAFVLSFLLTISVPALAEEFAMKDGTKIVGHMTSVTPDAIEVQNLFSKQTMLRQEIMRGRFFFNSGTIELIPRDEDRKKLKIAYLMNPDADFAAWFQSIPGLDAADSTGAYPEQRGLS